MKTLENQTLLYDEECPLCQAYTSSFIKTGMLDQNGRKPYAKLNEENYSFVDRERAANEIALIDTKNKTAIYGIDSILKVIGNSYPVIETLGKLTPVHYFLRKLYAFISYNRKVIIPGKLNDEQVKCEPTYNFTYRVAYLVFAVIITSFVLYKCAEMIPQLPKRSYIRELLLAAGQILFQGLFLIKEDRKTILTYFGNLMTVSLFGCLLLTPLIILNGVITVPASLVLLYFGLTVVVIMMEHYRRITLLSLPKFLTYTWILYRLIILILILNL